MAPKVLIIRPGALGDVCMTVPFAAALRRHVELHWLLHRAYLPIPRRFPRLGCRLIPIRPRRDRPYPASLVALLRRERYDAVLDLSHWPIVADLVAQLRDGPVRAITDDPDQDGRLGVNPRGVDLYAAYNCRVPVSPSLHQVDRWRALVRAALGLEVRRDWPLPAPKPPGRPLQLFVHPHASKPGKRWPAHRFAEVVRRLAGERPLVCTINSGSRVEVPQALALWLRLVTAGVRARILRLDRTYARLAVALEAADLALGCDSGPMHLAALLGTPSVVLYGRYPAHEFGPLWRSRAVEPPLAGQSASRIVPARVLAAVRAALPPLTWEEAA